MVDVNEEETCAPHSGLPPQPSPRRQPSGGTPAGKVTLLSQFPENMSQYVQTEWEYRIY